MHDRTRDNYPKSPALDAYIKRVDAVEKNFRRYVIEVSGKGESGRGYRREVAVIRIGADNGISCNSKEHAPTKEEAAAIKSELDASPGKFPHSITAMTIEKLLKQLGLKPDDDSLYLCPGQNRKGIDFVQQKVISKKNGNKIYVPWSWFSDGEWRKMEPDHIDGLPFWKPKKDRLKARVMIHEGAKAAMEMDDLVNNPERRKELLAHPWHDELVDHEHWGWLGGALNPHRVDWTSAISLAKTNTKFIFVADNDTPGKLAIPRISKQLRIPMSKITFDNRFKPAFDLADPWPRHEDWWSYGHYCGPTFDDHLSSATWATRLFIKKKEKDDG
jgi:hypothetical protein